jgi:hypothetical protein
MNNTSQLKDKTLNCSYILVELGNNKKALFAQKSKHIWCLKDMEGINEQSKLGLMLSDYKIKRQDLAKAGLTVLQVSNYSIPTDLSAGDDSLITFSIN